MNMVPMPATLTGEILSASDDVRVVAALHPLRQSRVERRFPAGLTLAELVEKIASEPGCRAVATDFQVHVEGHPIEARIWHRVRPKPATTITMRPVMAGPFAAIFAAIGAAISGFQAFIAGLGLFGKVLMAGLSLGAKLLMNALFAPRQPQLSQPKPNYSITSSRNQAAPFEPVPVILGKHRVAPFYGAFPYTETVGSDQYLRLLFVWGYGPLKVEDIKIGETPLSSFDEVEIETRQGFEGDAPVTLYPRQVVEEALSVDLKHSDGWIRRTTADNITEISIDVVFPNGLVAIDNKGRRQFNNVTVGAQYRLVGGGSWTSIPDIEVRAKTQEVIRRSKRVRVPAGQYEVEVRRATSDHESSEKYTRIEDVAWTALRGFRTGRPVTFPSPICVSAIRIKATSQLNGTVDTLNGVVTSLVRAWNGSAWVADTASRNPADLYRHVLQSAANKRPVADAKIDLAALEAWHAYCVANNWTFDKPLVSVASVYDTLGDICAAGRAIPVFKDGRWSVVWDEQDTPVVQMFTPRNSWGFEASHEFRDLPHAWRVRFVNAEKKWQQDERIVYDDGYTAETATRFEGLEFPGVTNADAVWRHGRFHIAQLRLRPETYTINVDFENLICTRGDRVRVAHDVMKLGLSSGRVVAVDAGAQTVILDEELSMASDTLYQVRFRLADGSFVVRSVVAGSSGDTETVALDGPGDLPAVGDLFTFGEADGETAVYRILGVEQQDELTARVFLVDDAPGIYLADTGAIPAFESNVTVPFDPFSQGPTDLIPTDGIYQEGSDFLAFVRLSWTSPRFGRVQYFEVEYRNEEDGSWQVGPVVAAPQRTAEVRGLDAGLYTFRVRCRFDDNAVSRWTTSEAFSADRLTNPPPDVTDFRVSALGDLSTLSWTAVQAVGVTYEIRFVAVNNETVSWNSATPLIPSVSGTSVQVPSMIGTYLIKAAYQTGIKSVNAAEIATSIAALAGLNVVEVLTENPTFVGTRENVDASNGVLRLLPNNVMAKWERLDEVVSLFEGDGDDDSIGVVLSGVYYFANGLDLGDVYTSRLTALIDAKGENLANVMSKWLSLSDVAVLDDSEPDDWEVSLEYRTTQIDPMLDNWSGWQPFFVGDVTARAYEFRLTMEGRASDDGGEYALTTPAVRILTVQVDMPDRVIAGDDIVVPAIGLDVDFMPPFKSLHGLATADQNMATGDRKAITAKGPSGFHIQFFNSAGTPVERTVDFVAKGYGSMIQ